MADPRIEAARETLAMVTAWLDSMERYPKSWGPPQALEVSCLAMVEVRQRLLRPTAHRANQYETREAWIRFIGSVNGGHTPQFLCDVLREKRRLKELPGLLGDMQRWIAQQHPPEISFDEVDG